MAEESSVFWCRPQSQLTKDFVVRLKKYYDFKQQMNVGKIDVLLNSQLLRSDSAKIYDIPLFNQDSYVRLWYAGDITVNAHLSSSQEHRFFSAIYKNKSEKLPLHCEELRN